jgi:2-(1,2-epoxy-1,2-dihydrophenyl)acetyl-CoA isomerase
MAKMDYQSILEKKEGRVVTITLNRPESLNFLDPIMTEEIEHALGDAEKNEDVGAVVITGAGRAFSAGGDLKFAKEGHTAYELHQRMEYITRFIRTMINLPKPIIASVNGPAVGIGCNIALAADMVLASETATFAEVFVRIGLIPDGGGIFLLSRRIGLTRAKDLIFSGRTINANEAEQMGMINRVFPAQSLQKETSKMALELASGPTMAIGIAKRLLNQTYESSFETLLRLENSHQALLRLTEDHQEGVKAFFEKRKPVFKGK